MINYVKEQTAPAFAIEPAMLAAQRPSELLAFRPGRPWGRRAIAKEFSDIDLAEAVPQLWRGKGSIPIMRRPLLLTAMLLVLCAASTPGYQSSPERRTITEKHDWGPWAGPFREKLVPSLMLDFGERYLYAPANAALPPPAPGERRVVFMGDSITDIWNLAASFPGRPYINRGIGSQVTAQMLVRFNQDVVALQPAAVVILGGVNDVTGFLQLETADGIVSNI
jgi:hypothetical protein